MKSYLSAEFVRWNKRLDDLAEKVLTEDDLEACIAKSIELKAELWLNQSSLLNAMEFRILNSYLAKIRLQISEYLRKDDTND